MIDGLLISTEYIFGIVSTTRVNAIEYKTDNDNRAKKLVSGYVVFN
jgi:hypothetical protein